MKEYNGNTLFNRGLIYRDSYEDYIISQPMRDGEEIRSFLDDLNNDDENRKERNQTSDI